MGRIPEDVGIAEQFWILKGGFFAQGGRKFSGPYDTKPDAFTARKTIEELTGSNTLYIDSFTGVTRIVGTDTN